MAERLNGRAIAYRELARSLRDALARGDFADGRRLPTEAQLAASWRVSRQTVRRALQELVSEGLIYRVRGRGTFATTVSPNARYVRSFGSVEDLLAYAVDTTMETISPLTRRVDVGAAGRLHLASDDIMVGLVRRAHDGTPFCLTRLFLPPEIGRKVLERGVLTEKGQVGSRTVIGVIDEVAPGRIAGAHQSVTAEAISADAASLLECAAGDPVLRIDRVYYDLSGKRLELAISHFNPDRYTHRIELSRRLV